MCVAAVGMVTAVQGKRAIVSFKGALQEVSLALLPHVKIGDHVVVHAGFAAEIVKDVPKLYQDVVATDARARQILDAIERETKNFSGQKIRIMNFCGSHENTVVQYGLRDLLPECIELVSGPGCPVCVTAAEEIALGLEVARRENVTLTTFGDLIRVPTPWGSLEQLQEEGADVRVIYDISQALQLARVSEREIVHFAIGFETTAPLTASVIREAQNIDNFSIISSHRVTPPAIEYVLANYQVDAVLCPGHVAMIIGVEPFRSLFNNRRIPYVISGFEPIDLLQGVLFLLQQLLGKMSANNNQYSRVVEEKGNELAQSLLTNVFTLTDAYWRGFDILPASRLILRPEYQQFDAQYRFGLQMPSKPEATETLCICNAILSGANPRECSLFAKACTPEHPSGPCMVSREGACHISYHNRE
ncbi:hypothetical protein SCACP_37250 [Sporomusa carbonis]|uniref:hydrogenase formation protein HypD n=1 Tax=Sporomusa carbonis TaxID=3076075 RepID=UPI003A73DB37